jgi:hypothetical protein
MYDPPSEGLFQRRRRSNRRFPEVHKPQVLRRLTLSKANPDPYTSYGTNMTCFRLFYCM